MCDYSRSPLGSGLISSATPGRSNHSAVVPHDEFPGNLFAGYMLAMAYLHIS